MTRVVAYALILATIAILVALMVLMLSSRPALPQELGAISAQPIHTAAYKKAVRQHFRVSRRHRSSRPAKRIVEAPTQPSTIVWANVTAAKPSPADGAQNEAPPAWPGLPPKPAKVTPKPMSYWPLIVIALLGFGTIGVCLGIVVLGHRQQWGVPFKAMPRIETDRQATVIWLNGRRKRVA